MEAKLSPVLKARPGAAVEAQTFPLLAWAL
jgi:hypothetical protein